MVPSADKKKKSGRETSMTFGSSDNFISTSPLLRLLNRSSNPLFNYNKTLKHCKTLFSTKTVTVRCSIVPANGGKLQKTK
jgi:hypothetical protein